MHVPACEVGLQHAEVLGFVVVEAEYPVSVPEAHLVGQVVDVDAAVLVVDVGLPPDGHYGYVCEYREDEVVHHASGHHEKPLPCRLGAELPFLRLGLQLLGVQGLVHHPGYLAVASERQPAYSEFGLSPFPACDGLASHIEEQIEFLHPYPEDAGPDVMSELMYDYEQGQGQDDLKRLNQYNHRRLLRFPC